MTTPPDEKPYESDIRANTSTGLGGLFAQLAAIAAGIGALPQVVTLLTEISAHLLQIRDDIRRLMGPPAADIPGWTGFQYQFGIRDAGEDLSLMDMLWLIQGNVRRELPRLETIVGTPSASLRNILNVLNTLNASATGLQAQLNSTNQTLGDIDSAPIGSTIKDLLRSIDVNALRSAECCEGAEEPPPNPPLNDRPSPETRCAVELGALRASNLVAFADANVTPDQLYMVEFSPINGVSGGRFQNGTGNYTGGVTDLPIVVADVDMNVCIDWNYTGVDNPSQATFYRFNPANLIGSGQNTLIGSQNDEQQSSQVFAVTAGQAFAVSIRVLQGNQPPGLNLWVAWGEPA